MTNTEYLLRVVRDSEHMRGWEDEFSKLREAFVKEAAPASYDNEQEGFEVENSREM